MLLLEMNYISCVINASDSVVENTVRARDGILTAGGTISRPVAPAKLMVPNGIYMAPGPRQEPPTGQMHVAPTVPGCVIPTGPSTKRVAPPGPAHATPLVPRDVSSAGPSQRLMTSSEAKVCVEIVEQPERSVPKFRYEKEGRFAGSILGVHSTPQKKTYPTIEIRNYTGKVKIVVSCITKDKPYRPHPHKLVGRGDHCTYECGLCIMEVDITPENRLVPFTKTGIQCVTRGAVENSLTLREKTNIDPFKTGFRHKTSPQDIDLNAVRLCFQVFVRNRVHLAVSDIIYDRSKDTSILRISETSCNSGSVRGDTKVILLCEKFRQGDINVVLCKDGRDGTPPWEAHADDVDFHKQVAIVFKTPPYRDQHTLEHVKVYIQLRSKTSNERSEHIPFMYIPVHQDAEYLRRKRKQPMDTSLLEHLDNITRNWHQEAIKSEPAESASPMQVGSSPINSDEPRFRGNSYQQWDSNVPATSNMDYYNQGFQWPAPYQVQDQSNMPPIIQTRSPLYMSNIRATSPNIHGMSPKAHVMPPQSQFTSPLAQVKSEDSEGPSMATGLGHMDHVFQNVSEQSATQPMESNSASSITKYLMETGGDNIDSGEIADLLESTIRDSSDQATNDISDSFSQLSTSDLLNTEIP